MMKKVVKFGGSSLASAEQFRKVGAIIREDEGRRYVVPSAPGKRFDGDTKVTDMLYGCYRMAEQGRDFKEALEDMKKAAQAGRDSTKDMVAKYGRSSRLGERSRGVLDAGATSCCIILTAMADGISELL